jgi:hypothetical protein
MFCWNSVDMLFTILNSAVALPYAAILFLNLRQSISVLCDVTATYNKICSVNTITVM